ncbi:MAG: hypothetical protein CBC67_01400 [Gammaproteobacteria bacterium TMED107]|nr:hypothetical protein [Gammaproteobacteria bacterium]OUX77145.1 MAG: hypothetical protein CBC67_01400 [Gammaproteobacteria bacterium TMED107]
MRFAQVDRSVTVNSVEHGPIESKLGSDEVAVYFGWEMSSARGLAPALFSYAAAKMSMSRTLRFEALA